MKLTIYKCIGLLLLSALLVSPVKAGEMYGFRVYLKDKANTVGSIDQPEDFLTAGAIKRREVRNIPIVPNDLPVSSAYVAALTEAGTTPLTMSRWMNTVVVASEDSLVAAQLAGMAMVDSVKWVWKGLRDSPGQRTEDTTRLLPDDLPLKKYYGYADPQINMLKGEKLHQAGFRGEGMTVAVIDAGFTNVDRMGIFDSLRLIGVYNMVTPGKSVFSGDDHGTKVLSCMAADVPGVMVGTAPRASYLLLKSEDNRSEFPIEEDYWVAAAEYADSMGVDVITTSLGYFTFDADDLSHHPSELDGHTAFISRGAAVVADKGILLFCSAGNEGCDVWEKITFPADVSTVLTIGSVTEKKQRSFFSSIGYTADGRVKPDVVALGTGCCVVDETGSIRYGNGTSFSTPILAGLGVCLWQALPTLTNSELIDLLKRSAHQYNRPDVELGYGIPNFTKAYKEGRKYVSAH